MFLKKSGVVIINYNDRVVARQHSYFFLQIEISFNIRDYKTLMFFCDNMTEYDLAYGCVSSTQ